MLEIKIRELCEKQGIKNPYQLQIAADLAPNTAARLFRNEIKHFTIETLDKLCLGLNCTPNDFLIAAQPKAQINKGKKGS